MTKNRKNKLLVALITLTVALFAFAVFLFCGVFGNTGNVNTVSADGTATDASFTAQSGALLAQKWKGANEYQAGRYTQIVNTWTAGNTAYYNTSEDESAVGPLTITSDNKLIINVMFNVGALQACVPTNEYHYNVFQLGFVSNASNHISPGLAPTTDTTLGSLSISFVLVHFATADQLMVYVHAGNCNPYSSTDLQGQSILYDGKTSSEYPGFPWGSSEGGDKHFVFYSIRDKATTDTISMQFTIDSGESIPEFKMGAGEVLQCTSAYDHTSIQYIRTYKMTVNSRAAGYTVSPNGYPTSKDTQPYYFNLDFLNLYDAGNGTVILAAEGWKSYDDTKAFTANPYIYVGSNVNPSVTSVSDSYTKISALKNLNEVAYSSKKFRLDGLKIYFRSPSYYKYVAGSFYSSINNLGLGFAKTQNGYTDGNFMCNLAPAIDATPTKHACMVYSDRFTMSDSNNVAFKDTALTQNKIGPDGTQFHKIIDDQTEYGAGIIMQFNYLASDNVWQISISGLGGTFYAHGASNIIYVSHTYFDNVLDPEGKTFFVLKGDLNQYYKMTYGLFELDAYVKFEEGKTVSVNTDGSTKNYNVAQGQKFTVPTPSSFYSGNDMFVGFVGNSAFYAEGDQFTIGNSNVTLTAKYLSYDIADGARVQKKQSLGTYGGIQFEATLPKESYDNLKSSIKADAIGMIIIPTDKIGSSDFTINTSGVQKLNEVTKAQLDAATSYDSGTLTYRGSLTDIFGLNFSRPMSARVYARFTIQGKTVYRYCPYDAANNSRSISEVAAAALNHSEADQNRLMARYVDAVPTISVSGSTATYNRAVDPSTHTNYNTVVNGLTSSSVSGTTVTLTFSGTKDFKDALHFTEYAGKSAPYFEYGFQSAMVTYNGKTTRTQIRSQSITEIKGKDPDTGEQVVTGYTVTITFNLAS